MERLLEALKPLRSELGQILVLDGCAGGPAAARNKGWRQCEAEWIAFLDDDVVPGPEWAERLKRDLVDLDAAVAASQGRVDVPRPSERRPNDWERSVIGLSDALWITADLAVRRSALQSVGGFDERFQQAYREDADFAVRLNRRGWRIAQGERRVEHPVPRAVPWVSVSRQRGNSDDVLMRAVHGRHWRRWSRSGTAMMPRHLLTTAALAATIAGVMSGRRRRTTTTLAGIWLSLVAGFAAGRIAGGPGDRNEVVKMLWTSVLIPPAASAWWLWGWLLLPTRLARGGPVGDGSGPPHARPQAILFDRDGTLIHDVPYNGDPDKVVPLGGARRALERLRLEGIPMAIVSNQSGVGRGILDREEVEAVTRRAEHLLGPLGPWLFCVHAPEDGCTCRKPAPGLIIEAARRLAVRPDRCAVVGDIAADVQAAQAVGAIAVLVPTKSTHSEDLRRAPLVAPTIEAAVAQLLGDKRP